MAWILDIPPDKYNILVICASINYTQNSSTKLYNYLFIFRAGFIILIEACDEQ
jgi:hypothetical protein